MKVLGHTLLFGALIVSCVVPCLLDRLNLERRDPVPIIMCWFGTMAGVLLAFLAAIALLLVPVDLQLMDPVHRILPCGDAHDRPASMDT
jgi:hypothetical protein